MAPKRGTLIGVDKPWCHCTKKKGFTCDWNSKYRLKGGKTEHFWVCATCFKPTLAFMSTCDICGELFKGPFPHLKFAYTCSVCEALL